MVWILYFLLSYLHSSPKVRLKCLISIHILPTFHWISGNWVKNIICLIFIVTTYEITIHSILIEMIFLMFYVTSLNINTLVFKDPRREMLAGLCDGWDEGKEKNKSKIWGSGKYRENSSPRNPINSSLGQEEIIPL